MVITSCFCTVGCPMSIEGMRIGILVSLDFAVSLQLCLVLIAILPYEYNAHDIVPEFRTYLALSHRLPDYP